MRPKNTMTTKLFNSVELSELVITSIEQLIYIYCILIDTIQSTNNEFTEMTLTMLLKVLQKCHCDSFNIMAVRSIETKGNKMAKLARFLVYEVHETDAQSFLMKVFKLVKATNILNMNSRENM